MTLRSPFLSILSRTTGIVVLIIVLASSCAEPIQPARTRPTPEGAEQSRFDAAVECYEELYFWGRLAKVASVFDADEITTESVSEAIMTFPAGIKETSRKALEGCHDALQRGLRGIERAERTAWEPWGLQKTWLNYRHYVYFCYRLFREEGDIFKVAGRLKTRTATAPAIAREFADDPYPIYYESTYDGCLDGLSQGQLDKSLGLFDGPRPEG